MRSTLIALGSHREAGPEPAPVLEHIVDAPDGKESVDHEQPLVHDAVIRADLSAGVFLDCAVLWVGLRSAFAHDRAASLVPGSASPARSVGGLPEERGASLVPGSASPARSVGGLPEERGASMVPGSASPARSVGGLPEERAAAFASSSAWSTWCLIASMSRNAPLVAPQMKALRAAPPMSSATTNSPRVRCSSIRRSPLLPDSGVVNARPAAVGPSQAGRLALGVECQPRVVG